MRINLSIVHKFIAGIVLILIGISIFFYIYFPNQLRSRMLEKERLNAEILIDVVSVGAGVALSNDDYYVLSLAINTAKQFPNIDYIVFLDNANIEIAIYNPENFTIDEANYSMKTGEVMEKDHLLIRSPLVYEDQAHGALLLKYSLNHLNTTVKAYKRTILLISLAVLFFGSFLGVLIARLITFPIKNLVHASNQVGTGDFNVKVKVKSMDEIGILAQTFNFMVENIKERQEELMAANEELEEQRQELVTSEEELQVQQEELTQTNQELEENSELLAARNQAIQKKNKELELAYTELGQKNQEIELAGRYKSEFLSNMSHELRTPLNSILLLSKLLADNHHKNLLEDEVESAKVIYNAGKGLLELINEILDLSKIEAGKMVVDPSNVSLLELEANFKAMFKPLADEKGVTLTVLLDKGLPQNIFIDKMRLEQVLKNLASNAFKFTERGGVTLEIFPARDQLPELDECIGFTVSDTGIGIPDEQQETIFEAFQQADGSTQRKYGGTGLGLSISREIVKLLNGRIILKSKLGAGSSFTFYLPYVYEEPREETPTVVEETSEGGFIANDVPEEVPDDRENIEKSDKVILIIEDDTGFASQLLALVRQKGYKGIVVVRGDHAVSFAENYQPYGIISDIKLPKVDGYKVLDNLKSNPKTRHIPVYLMSFMELDKKVLGMGAINFSQKPIDISGMRSAIEAIEQVVNNTDRKVLVIEGNEKHQLALVKYLENNGIPSMATINTKEAMKAFHKNKFDCIIIGKMFFELSRDEVLEHIRAERGDKRVPVIIYTGRRSSTEEEIAIDKFKDTLVVKLVESYKGLVNEVSIFMHLNSSNKDVKPGDEILDGKKVLLADDDPRTVFSITKLLEGNGIQVDIVQNGKEAVDKLEHTPDMDLILMDVMMPEMDGLEAMTKIRKIETYRNTPMIAVTAKTMSGDRKKCIDAGASDYISKPVDADQLLSLLRVWLYN